MKITKNDLRRALYALNDVMISGSSELAEKAIAALESDTLEIEGYEISKWIKFDSSNPKTHPPKNTVVLLAVQGLPLSENIHTWTTHLQERHNAQGLPGIFTHWRNLPPPIQKED